MLENIINETAISTFTEQIYIDFHYLLCISKPSGTTPPVLATSEFWGTGGYMLEGAGATEAGR